MTADGQIIPEDIIQAAEAVTKTMPQSFGWRKITTEVAKAILAERERCATIADRYGTFTIDTEHGEGYATAASNIAAAIRTGA